LLDIKSNESILILEKDHLLKLLYKDEFADEGYVTVFADNDSAVMQEIRAFSPELFITNYHMSSSEAFGEMLLPVRKKEHIPIIINTAYLREMLDAACNEVAEYFPKTEDVKARKTKIETLLHPHN
jgi:DNA-binding NtrC family response regulator